MSITPESGRLQNSASVWRVVGKLFGAILLAVVLIVGALAYLGLTEHGAKTLWQAARTLSGGRLSGVLEAGVLASGVRFSELKWRSAETEIRIDHLNGKWGFARAPWRFAIDFLHLDTLDIRVAAAEGHKKTPLPKLPHALSLPLAVEVQQLRVNRLRVHQGMTTTVLTDLLLDARSTRTQHQLNIASLTTPFGQLSASAQLDSQSPFTLSGQAKLSSVVKGEAAQLEARLSGSLENMKIAIDASGMKLAGRAEIEAAPFDAVPLKRVIVTADHVNPQAFSPTAPAADLSLRVALQPQSETARQGQAKESLVVAGTVSIVNKNPGPLDKRQLPLREAHAQLQLDQQTQRVSGLKISLLEEALLTGQGVVKNGRGRFDLRVEALNLYQLAGSLRPTKLAGPMTITLAGRTQHLNADLTDPHTKMRLQTDITVDPLKMTLNTLRLQRGDGQAEWSGVLQKNLASDYRFKVVFSDFDPFTFFHQATSDARLFGTLDAHGALAARTTQLSFALDNRSVYAGLPLTGGGKVHWAGARLLPSDARLSIAGNKMALRGRMDGAGSRLVFDLDAPQLERIGLGVSGALSANGDISGTLTRPSIVANYQATALAFGKTRIGQVQGRAELRDGIDGSLMWTLAARDAVFSDITLNTLSAQLSGTRSRHDFSATAVGKVGDQTIDVGINARGQLSDVNRAFGWKGEITQFNSRGVLTAQLAAPMSVAVKPHHITLGAARLTIENALLDLRTLVYERNNIHSAGTLMGIDVQRLLKIQTVLTGKKPRFKTDLVLDGDWDFTLANRATGYAALTRRAGDIHMGENHDRGSALGINALALRVDLSDPKATLTARAQATRIGIFDAEVIVPLTRRRDHLALAQEAPLAGKIMLSVPELKTVGQLFGPQYLLDGRAAFNLTLSGQLAQPKLSGAITGDALSMIVVDEGITLKNGIVRIMLDEDHVDFRQVEFSGARGLLRATGGMPLNRAAPALSVKIVADKFDFFATPEKRLSISGQATLANGTDHLANALVIDGVFNIDHALLDFPKEGAPKLGDDVHIVRASDKKRTTGQKMPHRISEKRANRLIPYAFIHIDLGQDFRFYGSDADLNLQGALNIISRPTLPLRAQGTVRVLDGSTYEAFGRKLNIEKGYFTFNGPVDNPGIHLLAMRRNQQVAAGVQMSGTLRALRTELVSQPEVPEEEKISWLLFGQGSKRETNVGQKNTLAAALALLGNSTGKQIAKKIGLDELSIGQSEVGLTDPQIISVIKALNEHLAIGYEQGLTTSASIFKATWQFWNNWSIVGYAGSINGVNLLFNRHFD
jgi:translocation and assembly module TamB